jgi:hypothetical protein
MYMYSYSKQSALKNALVFSAGAAIFLAANANTVVPPPLPTGSHMVRQHAGASPDEVQRNKRAHHHKGHHKKDVTRDDTIDDVPEDKDTGHGNGNGNGNGKKIAPPKSK